MDRDLPLAEHARRLHRDALVADLHADTPSEFFLRPDYDFGRRHAEGHVDLVRLREAGVDVQVLVAWVPADRVAVPGASFRHAADLIDAIHRVIDRTAGARVVTNAAGIRSARATGELAALIGVEGGHAIENSVERLRELRARGALYLTLTWNNGNDWADASGSPPRHGGLTPFGREVVRELNRLRMLVDVSHVADTTFDDVLSVADAPIIASHSCARALADHPRNLNDDQLRALAASGGVVGVNFFPAFLDGRHAAALERVEALARSRERVLRRTLGDPDRARRQAQNWRARALAALPPVRIEAIADHIDYIATIAGIDHVALGSDFDGIATVPADLPDIAALPTLTEHLLRRGYDEAALRKVLGGNFLRVLTAVAG